MTSDEAGAVHEGVLDELHRTIDVCLQALKSRPNDLSAIVTLGSCYMQAGHMPNAGACFRKATQLDPENPRHHESLGMALLYQSKFDEAAVPFKCAIALAPAHSAPAYAGLALIALRKGDQPQAAGFFRQAHECEPDSRNGKFNQARALLYDGHLADAEGPLREAILLDPSFADAYRLLGQILQQLGRFADAEVALQALLDLDANRGQPYLAIVTGRKVDAEDRSLLQQMRLALASGKTTPGDECSLHYALGKSLHDLGEYREALEEYDQANAIAATIMFKGRAFDPDKLRRTYEHATRLFTKDFFKRNRALGSESELPVFIVGMMRSGTTLTEQILSCHPDVGGAGELSFWTRGGLSDLDPRMDAVDPRRLRQTQEECLQMLERLAPGKKRVTDKRNSNRFFLGQIHVAFPRAKIIHCHRDPVDNAMSIYMTPNTAPVEFAHVRENIVTAYKEYRRLMDHYRRVLAPGTILDVRYEELVADQEGVTRRMIDFLGLEWNDACLRHEQNARAVSTPSLWQARQPIFATSVKRWKHYEPWLGAFAELIGGDPEVTNESA